MDNEFKAIDSALKEEIITLNTTAEDDHMNKIEWRIQLIKERLRA